MVIAKAYPARNYIKCLAIFDFELAHRENFTIFGHVVYLKQCRRIIIFPHSAEIRDNRRCCFTLSDLV